MCAALQKAWVHPSSLCRSLRLSGVQRCWRSGPTAADAVQRVGCQLLLAHCSQHVCQASAVSCLGTHRWPRRTFCV